MSTTKEFLAYVLEHMADWPEFRHRAMMGEYVVYWRDKVVGGIYDNRRLLEAMYEELPAPKPKKPKQLKK